jgi:hypothetical protein
MNCLFCIICYYRVFHERWSSEVCTVPNVSERLVLGYTLESYVFLWLNYSSSLTVCTTIVVGMTNQVLSVRR